MTTAKRTACPPPSDEPNAAEPGQAHRPGAASSGSARLIGANIEHAGQHNQRVVLHAIRVNGALARSDLAAITGLTHATVTNITNRLLEIGLLDRAGRRRGGRGQPATRLVVRPEGAFSIGINVDRDHLTMVAVDFGGTVRARIGREMPFPTPDDVHAFYREHVEDLLAVAAIRGTDVTGIGVALPDDLGEIDMPGRPSDYDRWSHADLAALFEGPLDVPVLVENDAAAAAMGEMQFGLGQQVPSFFYLLVTFALGGGVVINSLYDRGADGRSGEIGFLLVDDGAGGKTQLQSIVSLAGFRNALNSAGLADVSVRSPDLGDAAVARVASAWVDRSAHALLQPLIAVNCLINPDMILVGGRLPGEIIGQVADRAQELLHAQGRNVPVVAPVRRAALAEDAAAVGAALLPFAHLMLPADAQRMQVPTIETRTPLRRLG